MKENKQPKLIKLGENAYQYEDLYGNKSEIFYAAQEYKFGFAHVKQTKNSKQKQRDLLGRISSLKTASGVYFYRFLKGEILFSQLPAQFFVDKKFCQGVEYALLDKLAEEIRINNESGIRVDIKLIKKQKDQIHQLCLNKRKLGFQLTNAKAWKNSGDDIENS